MSTYRQSLDSQERAINGDNELPPVASSLEVAELRDQLRAKDRLLEQTHFRLCTTVIYFRNLSEEDQILFKEISQELNVLGNVVICIDLNDKREIYYEVYSCRGLRLRVGKDLEFLKRRLIERYENFGPKWGVMEGDE